MKIAIAPQPLLLPSPALIVGTYGIDGKPNMMYAAWGGIAASKPPCVSVSLREATLTHGNIAITGDFTVNFPSEKYFREADFVGIVSGRSIEKFKETRLTPVKSELVAAPIIAEFPLALECRLIKQVEIGSHTMFIGEILGIVADSDVLGQNGLPDIEKVRPMVWGSFGSMAYYGIGDKLGDAFSAGKDAPRAS